MKGKDLNLSFSLVGLFVGSFPSLWLNRVAWMMSSLEQGDWFFLVLSLASSVLAATPLQTKGREQGVRKSTAFLLGQRMRKCPEKSACLWKMLMFHFLFLTPNIFICWVIKENKFCLSSLYLLPCHGRVLSTKTSWIDIILAQIAIMTWIYLVGFFKVLPSFYTYILCYNS